MNWSTFVIGAIVCIVFLAIVISGIRKVKSGKGFCSCGGSCGGCSMKDCCHKE